ncbi:Alkbh3 [Symbiodinium pilosum]|uniref:Alkbh3 protein n=1 Tax=Symbiodinium pilosum TaxID=2952 RepID=A0A812Q7V4_SYMPI|nr:Alkbh3 [Symbiodinium pilosum]
MGPSDSGAIRRLGLYGRLLTQALKRECADLDFQVGVRSRRGSSRQLSAHLLSCDFVAPDPMDLTQQHYLEFTGGPDSFLPLDTLAGFVERGTVLPQPKAQHDLRCHRCGQFFGDSMRQLVLHLRRRLLIIGPALHDNNHV